MSTINILDLAKSLAKEKLFVKQERSEIEGLNRKVQILSTGLFHQTWLTGQNRLGLENLSRGPVASPFLRPFVVPAVGDNDLTENLEIVEAHKHIPPRYLQSFIDLISILRTHPDLVGLCISTYEKEKSQSIRQLNNTSTISFGQILQVIINVYGGVGGPLPCDATLNLQLLNSLATHQLVGAESPRKILRQGSIAFSTLYRLISETIPSSRLFLIGALHQPVTLLLASQELLCLGTIPTSPLSVIEASTAFSNATANDIALLDRTEKMARLTKLFIESILDHIHAFPKGLAWIIKSIHSQLRLTHSSKEVSVICTDLIWALFICPAVTNPEPFGVTDAPVGNEARHALSQIATILQALALHRWEGTDPRMAEYISYFELDSLSSVLDHVLSIDGLPTEPNGLSLISRRTVLVPENLLQPLCVWLKECISLLSPTFEAKQNDDDQAVAIKMETEGDSNLTPRTNKNIPSDVWSSLVKLTSSVNTYYDTLNLTSATNSSLSTFISTPNNTTQTLHVNHSSASTSSNSHNLSNSNSNNNSPSHSSSAANFLANGKRTLLLRKESPRHSASVQTPAIDMQQNVSISVVEFPITQNSWEWIGMLPESDVIVSKNGNGDADSLGGGSGIDLDGPEQEEEEREEVGSIGGEKRTRFSLSQDDGLGKVDWDFENHVFLHCNYRDGKVVKLSGGNAGGGTSDNLEAVSEAASTHDTHSVSSSIELEDQNDNLSDMLSANVSGRGTPDVSGRNTPQDDDDDDDNDDEDRNNGGNQNDVIMQDNDAGAAIRNQNRNQAQNHNNNNHHNLPPNQPPNNMMINPPNMNNLNLNGNGRGAMNDNDGPSKQARSEIEDKFCKFEIKKLFGGDETVSLVSETWSIDALASDSEMGGERDQSREAPPSASSSNSGLPLGGNNLLTSNPSLSVNVNNNQNNNNMNNNNNAPNVGIGAQLASSSMAFLPTGSSSSVVEGIQNNDTMSEAWSIEGTTSVAANDIERLHDFDNDDTASVARSDDTGRSDGLEEIAYDTPRSSVSGSGPYRRPEEPDLLLFDDVQPQSLPCSVRINPDLMSNDNEVSAPEVDHGASAMEVEISSMQISSSSDVISRNREERHQSTPISLIPEIIGPSTSSQMNLVPSSSNNNTLGAAASGGSSSNSRSGAIPKTISFDKTAERGDREHWDDESGRTRRFFRNFRLPFRGRNRKSAGRHEERYDWEKERCGDALLVPKLRKSLSEDVNSPASQASNESSDDILAKYRRKPSLTDSNDGSISGVPKDGSNNSPKFVNFAAGASGTSGALGRRESIKITKAELIHEARKKLRNALCSCDLHQLQGMESVPIDVTLVNILHVEVASAISRADQTSAAQLQEALRTVKQLGTDGCRKVVRLLRDDLRRRSDYVAYLMKAKQCLLSTVTLLERATIRAKHEGDTYSHYLIKECIRLWTEEPKQEKLINQFRDNFRVATTIDEKIEMLDSFLDTLVENFVGTKELTEWQLSKAESSLEQTIVSKIYLHALYPNGEADLHRDALLRDHIARLETIITPSHPDLRIPKSRLADCPWPPVQREIKMLSAYKTPTAKLRCVNRAASLIVSLLSADKVVSADDIMPVLVFILIKCNPPALLSTIQYVNSFCGQKIIGEELYWWTQFCSAVEFIKTM